MKIKSPSLLLNSTIRLMALITDLLTRAGLALQKRDLATSKGALLVLFALVVCAKLADAQTAGPIGLPVIFVHGICDTADSFLPAEQAVRATLESHYPTQYPLPSLSSDPDEYVVFYDGVNVSFQVPPASQYNPVLNLNTDQIAKIKTRRFFLVALDDPGQTEYQFFDAANEVANIPIYQKGNELAHIIWKIKEITGAPRVIVVSHSMGGLDTRAYIEGLASPNGTTDTPIPYFNDIAALVTLDTPHGGSLFAGLSASVLSGALGACASNDSVDKSEMFPQGMDPITQTQSIIPQLNYYQSLSLPYTYTPQPLPSALTITSIASYWYDPGALFPRLDEGTDDVLTSLTQDVASNLANSLLDSNSTLASKNNTFNTNFPEYGNAAQSCGTTSTPLHFLTCTGSVGKTFSLIEDAVVPSLIATSGNVTITPDISTVAPGTTANYAASTGTSTVWSILEGQNGGSITPTTGETVTYQAPANYTHSTETFHVIAINSTSPSQYATVTVQVSSSFGKTTTTTTLSPSATQVPIGVSLTINATTQASGGTPTGTVTFYDGTKALSTAILNNAGVAIYSTSSLSLGSHLITAQYSGDSNYSASTTSLAVTITVVAIAPQLSVSPTGGSPGVTSFVKTDTGFTPYGLITHTATFPDNSVSVLQTNADLNGIYSYSRTYTMLGKYTQIDTDVTTGQTTTPVSWTVSTAVVNDFSLQMSPTTQAVNQGGSVTYTVITATTSGSSQSISLNATNLPSGVTASFNPSTVTSGSQSILTLSATSTAATGTYPLTLVGTGSSASHSIPFSATVAQVNTSGAVLTASPLSFNYGSETVDSSSSPFVFSLVNTGGTALTISSVIESPQFFASFLNGQGLPLTLQPNGGYANMQVVFVPNATGQQTGTIKLFNSTNASPLTLNVSGTGVAAPVTTGNIQVNVTFNGSPWNGFVGYTVTGPESYNGGTAPNTYYNLVPGAYTIAYTQGGPGGANFTGLTPSATQTLTTGTTLTYTLNFTGLNTFGLGYATPTSAVVAAGSSVQFQLNPCYETGGTQTVTLAVAGLPAGTTATFSPNPVSVGCSGAITTASLTTSSSTPPGIYSLVFTGTNQDGYSDSNALHPTTLTVDEPPVSPTNRVSLSNTGVQGNGLSGASNSSLDMVANAVSGNGRFVAFVSAATNLVPNDTNSQQDIFVRDLQLGTTTRASVASNGTQGDNQSLTPSISGDGRYVSFSSVADNLVAGSVPGQQGVYLHDMTTGITNRLDLAPNGSAGNDTACCSSVSGDGRFIAFASAAANLMQGVSGENVYRYDTKTQQLSLASVASDGITVGGGTSPQISADGRFVAFTSFATNLVTGDTNGKNNAFVHDFATGQTTRVNVASDGTQDNCGVSYVTAIPVAISADGRYLAFISCGNTLAPSLVNPYEFDTAYVHDMNTGQTSALLADSQNNVIFIADMGTLSADGRFVSFGRTYLDDRTTGQFTLLNVAADGTVGNGASYVATTSMDGSSAVFSSNSTNLVANDTNTNTDVFSFANPFLSSPHANFLTLGASQAPGGSQVTGTITLNGPAPTGGATVAVWSNNPTAQPPAEVLVPAGATSASFTIPTTLVPSETVMTIIASYNGGSEVSLLTLEPAPQLAVSPSAWDFGYQAVGTNSAPETLVLTNSGTAALTLNSVQLANGQVFSIKSNTCGSSIVAGGSCSVSVVFSPSASGSATDSLQISYGNPATIQSISLTGNGATPLAALSPTPLSFGNQALPGSTTAVATLSNSGNASLSNISASVSGTNTGDFAISSDGCSGVILPANSNCLVTIAFTPKAKGSRQATLSIADSASGSPQTISLTGTGVQSTPTLLWNPSTAAITYGTPLGTGVLNATANQSGSNLAGTFAYTATMNGGTPQVVTKATVLGAGMYTLTATFTPTDATDYTTATATVSITVNPATPTVTVTPSTSSITTAQPLTVTITVNGGSGNPTPTGSVKLTSGGYTSAAATLSGSSATINVPAGSLTKGTDTLSVTYTPDANSSSTYNSATGTSTAVTVTQAKTTPTVTVTPGSLSITTAQPLTVTVAVAGGTGNPTPTGSVKLTSGGYTSTATALSSGSATINVPAGSLATGSDGFTASYTPDSNSSSTYNNATGSNSVTVTAPAKTTPTVTVTPSASSITTAQPLTVTVAVAGGTGNPTPTGSVTLASGSYTSATTTLSGGSATMTIPAGSLAVGSDGFTASYTPDAGSSSTYNIATGYSSAVTVTQAKTTPTVTVTPSASSITTAQPLTVTVAVSGTPTPTGSVILTGGGYTSTATTLSSGSASINISAGSLATGSDTLTASYTPDSSSSSTYNSATGTSSTVAVTQPKTTPTMTVTPSASSITTAQPLTVTVALSGTPTPTGSVTLTGGGYSSTQTLSGGSATFTIAAGSLSIGGYTFTANYTPDSSSSSTYNSATGSNSVTVTTPAKTTPTITWSTPAAITYGTALSATQLDATASVAGTFSYSPSLGTVLAAGSQTLTANFTPTDTTDYNNATATVTLTVNKATPTITWRTPAAITVGTALSGTQLNATANVPGTFVYSPAVGTAMSTAGNITLSTTFTPTDTTDDNSTSATVVLTVTTPAKTTPTVTVTPSASSLTTAQALTVTVAVSGTPTPTGSVTLSSGTYTSAATTLSSGSATINVPAGSLASGTDQLTASYTGDTNYNASTGSASVTVTTAGSSSFTVTGPAVSVTPGATTGNTSTITLTPSGGFTGAVALTAAITSSPTGAAYPPTLSFGSTSPVSITGSNAGTATLTISTTAATTATLVHPKHPAVPWYAAGGATLACILLFGVPTRRRRWRTMLGMLFLVAILAGGMSACTKPLSTLKGGGTSNPGTTAGTYTITVTGTSGSTTATGIVALTVQ
jgi:hypothetical protein